MRARAVEEVYIYLHRGHLGVYNTYYNIICEIVCVRAVYILKYYAESVAVAVRAKGLAYRLTW